MRNFTLLIFGLCYLIVIFFAHAEVTESNAGHIGSALDRIKGSDFLTVEYVAANSPAAEAGIKKGDCIVAINSISTQGMSIAQARHSVEGGIGGMVKLTVRHEDSMEEQVSVVRRSLLDTYFSAAMGGDSKAEFYLGCFYDFGPASTRDLAKALEWYRKAANQGDAPAQVSLGYMYGHGLGVPKDFEAATTWYFKAAKQGDPVAERNLALHYYRGEGVQQSDREAFDWFYSAAQQGDSTAEEYLGLLYRKGRGVVRNDREAFDWYYQSARHDNFYGEWGLAYMYQEGLGVTQNTAEALEWYKKAQSGLPKNENLKKQVALINLKAFLENPNYTSVDLSLITTLFRWQILRSFLLLASIYVAGGIVLFYFNLKAPNATPRLATSIGWLAFYVESQGVAFLAVCIFGKLLTAEILIIAMSLFSALPVIASSCGPNRNRIWKASQVTRKNLLLYGASSCLVILIISLGYDKIYGLITHSSLPLQPTQILIGKAKHTSAGLTYVTIALIFPAVEEIIFRSYLFDALRQRFSGEVVVIITALVFSLVHFQWLYFAPLFGLGLVLGWVKLKTDSLRLPFFLHSINNALFLAFAV